MSDVQRRLTDLPHSWCSPAFRCVICTQWPIAPTHTSGGCVKDCRTTADVFPSLERVILESYGASDTRSSPRQNSVTLFPNGSTLAIAVPPSAIPAKIIFAELDDHVIQDALIFKSAERLLIR